MTLIFQWLGAAATFRCCGDPGCPESVLSNIVAGKFQVLNLPAWAQGRAEMPEPGGLPVCKAGK